MVVSFSSIYFIKALVSLSLSNQFSCKQIWRTRAESQQIVAQGHSHAYNTPFYFKSYTKDLSLPIFEIVLKAICANIVWRRTCTIVCSWTLGPNVNHVTPEEQHIVVFSLDSGLEAFSRNPAHGSFSALTFQSTEFANYVNQRFLSY